MCFSFLDSVDNEEAIGTSVKVEDDEITMIHSSSKNWPAQCPSPNQSIVSIILFYYYYYFLALALYF